MNRLLTCALSVASMLIAGCDMLGIESPEKVAASRDADGKAIGSACRHAGRNIEDCFTLYKKADRAAIFAGWRDMNDYMRENKIEPAPSPTAQGAKPRVTAAAGNVEPAEEASTSATPASAKASTGS